MQKPTYRLREGNWRVSFPNGQEYPLDSYESVHYPGFLYGAPSSLIWYELSSKLLKDASSILDFGSGSGYGLQFLTQQFPEIIGYEPSSLARTYCEQRYPGHKVAGSVSDAALRSKKFDGILLIETLNEVARPSDVLNQVAEYSDETTQVVISCLRADPSVTLDPTTRNAFSEWEIRAICLRAGFSSAQIVWNDLSHFVVLASGYCHEHRLRFQALQGMPPGSKRKADELDAYVALLEQSGNDELNYLTWCDMARCALSLGDAERCGNYALNARELLPNAPEAWTILAQLTLAGGKIDCALDTIQSALERDPRNREALCCFAECGSAISNEGFVDALFSAHRADPGNFALCSALAQNLANLGRYSEALIELERSAEFESQLPPDYYLCLSWLMMELGRFDDAKLQLAMAEREGAEKSALSEIRTSIAQKTSELSSH